MAINLNTNHPWALKYRGLSRANQWRFADALADLNEAIKREPQESEAYRDRAMVQAVQKDYELALADASKSIELNKNDALAFATRGRIKNGLKDYKSALADFDAAIKLNPNDVSILASRAATWMAMDDFTNAAADLTLVLQKDPKNPTAFLVRGLGHAKLGEDDAALADFKHAAELAPDKPEPMAILGEFQYKTAEWKPALENCRKAVATGRMIERADLNAFVWLIRAQSGEEAAANAELNDYLKSLPAKKTNDWSAITARFFMGRLSESNFIDLATTAAKRPSAVRGQVCESFYYSGMKRKMAGDTKGALELFQKCLDTKYDNSMAYFNAVAEVRASK